MSKFHINKHGVPARCHAKEGNCPLGEDNHYDTLEEAVEVTERKSAEKYGLLPGVDKESAKEESELAGTFLDFSWEEEEKKLKEKKDNQVSQQEVNNKVEQGKRETTNSESLGNNDSLEGSFLDLDWSKEEAKPKEVVGKDEGLSHKENTIRDVSEKIKSGERTIYNHLAIDKDIDLADLNEEDIEEKSNDWANKMQKHFANNQDGEPIYLRDGFRDADLLQKSTLDSSEEDFEYITKMNAMYPHGAEAQQDKLKRIAEKYLKEVSNKKKLEKGREEAKEKFDKLDGYLERGESIPEGEFTLEDAKTIFKPEHPREIVRKYGTKEQVKEWNRLEREEKEEMKDDFYFLSEKGLERNVYLEGKFNEIYGKIDEGDENETAKRYQAKKEWVKDFNKQSVFSRSMNYLRDIM